MRRIAVILAAGALWGGCANVSQPGGNGRPTEAAEANELTTMQKPLAEDANACECCYEDDVRLPRNERLLMAVFYGHLANVKKLIGEGADVNAKGGSFGYTPLMYAVFDTATKDANNADSPMAMLMRDVDHMGVMKYLLENGADVNAQTEYGATALEIAATLGDIGLIGYLLQRGADVNPDAPIQYTKTPLSSAASQGHTEAVRLLLENGANVNPKGPFRESVLMTAAKEGHAEVVKILLEAGADANAPGTVLAEAARAGHVETVRILLDNGATGSSEALWDAARRGHAEMARLLLEHGADINATSRVVTRVPAEPGSEFKWRPKRVSNVTPLMEAAMNGYAELVRIFLENGSDINLRDSNGQTALGIAKEKGHTEVVEMLEKAGAKE